MRKENPNYTHAVHPFRPLYNENSGILIMGSIPSPASREVGFYYGHLRTGTPAQKMPSTSPANAAWSLERLKDAWERALL